MAVTSRYKVSCSNADVTVKINARSVEDGRGTDKVLLKIEQDSTFALRVARLLDGKVVTQIMPSWDIVWALVHMMLKIDPQAEMYRAYLAQDEIASHHEFKRQYRQQRQLELL